jgi:Domain of unknown function (DUF4114)
MAPDPLVPINTPFSYNVGINYESWENGRTGYSIAADLDQITQYFGLIKTFHDVAVGTANPNDPIIDPTQQQVISYVANTANVELAMGTLNSALAQGGFGQPWTPGLMTSSTYTDKWVEMLINAFGSVAKVQQHLKVILLGNEIDQNGPPPDNASFTAYQTWIQQSFDNLGASLSRFGLGSIPVSTTIANYGPSNLIAVNISAYIESHWSGGWVGGKPVVFYNQYTQGTPQEPMSSTDYGPVIKYFESVYKQLSGNIEPFVGETGYSTLYGQANQITVYDQISAWLTAQYQNGGKTVPLFAFDAFDQPSRQPPVEISFGIFAEDGSHRPMGLKPGLTLPAWTKLPISMSGNDRLALFSGVFSPGITVDGGAGTDTLVLGEPHSVDLNTGSLVSVERLEGSAGDDTVTMTADQFIVFDFIDLGGGADALRIAAPGAGGLPAGSTVVGFGGEDSLDMQGVLAGRAAVSMVKTDGGATLGFGGLSFQLAGDFSGGDFMTVARGSGAGAHTLVTFEKFLPSLSEGVSVDASSINGVANEPFLTGDGVVGFALELKSAVSAHNNTLGVYKVAADGTIYDVDVVFAGTLNVAAGLTVSLGVPGNNEKLGFFLIQDGFDLYGNLPDDLSLVMPGTTDAANLGSGVPPVLRSAALGNLTAAPIFHSFATFNPGDANQVLSGVAPGGRELLICFEDLPAASGDNDFQDVVFCIRVSPDDNLIV